MKNKKVERIEKMAISDNHRKSGNGDQCIGDSICADIQALIKTWTDGMELVSLNYV